MTAHHLDMSPLPSGWTEAGKDVAIKQPDLESLGVDFDEIH
jgi:hypothetical protein